tara:strand:+ start:306 stop:545 length:240 start_codon:yes stop_codon:yes gene_type:complete
MKVTYEIDYIVFDVTKGPKAIVEVLNDRGNKGWYPANSVNVAGTNLVFFLVKPHFEVPENQSVDEKHLNKLWGNKSGSE